MDKDHDPWGTLTSPVLDVKVKSSGRCLIDFKLVKIPGSSGEILEKVMGFSRSFPRQTLRGPKSAPRPRGRWHATATGEPEPAHGGAQRGSGAAGQLRCAAVLPTGWDLSGKLTC